MSIEHRVVCVGHVCGTWHDIDPEARIREIEAELAFYRGLKDVAELRARAEKAETRVAELRLALDEYEANQDPREDTFNQEKAREREAN